ncbi:MAG: hypothetical protein IJ235_00850 [Eubacterium sp.]|nr:hypothetical protein [Eubacterium sp.]MBQ8981310.1 hypothetical protein [Eubacterium sp.]MBR1531452.1 hypothetical protein [Eubacterium sp.]
MNGNPNYPNNRRPNPADQQRSISGGQPQQPPYYQPQQQMQGMPMANSRYQQIPQGGAAPAKKNKTGLVLGIVGGIIAVMVVVVIILIFALGSSNNSSGVPQNLNTSSFHMATFESELDSIEKEYLDSDGNIKKGDIDAVLKKDKEYLDKYNSTHHSFKSVTINQSGKYIECLLDNGNTYCHVPGKNLPSRIVDPSDETVQTEDEDDSSNDANDTDSVKTGDYTNIEKALVKSAPDIVGCCMEFRGANGKIYYYDNDYQPTGVYSYDVTTDTINKDFPIKSAEELGLENYIMCRVSLGEKGCAVYQYCMDNDFQTVSGSEHLEAYTYDGEDISKNANSLSGEFDGDYWYSYSGYDEPINQVDAIDAYADEIGNSDIVFDAERDLPDLDSDYHINKLYTSSGNMFAVFRKDDGSSFALASVDGDDSQILFEFDGDFYMDEDRFYYVSQGKLNYIDTTDDDYNSTEVADIDCDVLYFVTADRAYYCKRIDNGQKASICRIDLESGETTELFSGGYALGGY